MVEAAYFGTALIASALGIALFRKYGPLFAAFDIPNERSSHTTPTLRGGGIVIVLVCLLLYIASASFAAESVNWAFVAGGALVSLVSWIDDTRNLPPWIRFAAHIVAAGILLAGSGPIPGIALPSWAGFSFGEFFSYAVTLTWIAWMINAYNFMDGIDGIAGSQGVAAGLSWAVLGVWLGLPGVYILGGVIGLASLGFLLHNWSPARVFMGDVGSAFLGYTLAALPLVAQPAGSGTRPLLFAASVSFVWLFVFDTVLTLIRRLLRREKVWIAHRQHLYQRLVIREWSHSATSIVYAGAAAIVSGAFLLAVAYGGKWIPLLLFIYLAAPAVVVFFAFRKKV